VSTASDPRQGGTTADAVFVEAHARLHFGVLDLRGSLGRWFGGIGAAAPAPTLLLSADRAERVTADGPDADRALEFAQRFLAHHGATQGAHLTVHRALPAHAGLGSGTQLALSVARALAELYALPADGCSRPAAWSSKAGGRARATPAAR
jgi:beta-ribofuranosylaminobenzene 5'-phosphate synthase